MERRRKLIRFRKIGGGSLRLGNRIIKQNQVFSAYQDEISKAFWDCIIPLNPKEIEEDTEAIDTQKEETDPLYFVKKKGGAWYDIVSREGKVINEKSLHKKEAEQMCEELNV